MFNRHLKLDLSKLANDLEQLQQAMERVEVQCPTMKLDKECRIITVSDTLCNLLGLAREHLLGK